MNPLFPIVARKTFRDFGDSKRFPIFFFFFFFYCTYISKVKHQQMLCFNVHYNVLTCMAVHETEALLTGTEHKTSDLEAFVGCLTSLFCE